MIKHESPNLATELGVRLCVLNYARTLGVPCEQLAYSTRLLLHRVISLRGRAQAAETSEATERMKPAA